MTQKYDRFKSAPWFQEGIKPSVLIGGAGGIGSWLTVLLNRAGFETYVYDFDRLEEINMAGQLFAHKSIGMNKVDALAEITQELCREQIIANFAKVDEKTMTNEIAFAAFDNIKARKDMFTSWVNNYRGNKEAIFIDGRLTAEQLTIFSIRGDDEYGIKEYQEDHLPDDSTIPELQCTLKQTSHGAAMIAAHMVEMFTNWYSVVLKTDESRYTPFFWEYLIPIGYCTQRDANKPEIIESPAGYKYEERVGHVIDTPPLQESKKEAESTPDHWTQLPSELVMVTTEAANTRAWAMSSGHSVDPMQAWYCNGIFQFNAMLCYRSDGSQYIILDEDGGIVDWPLKKGETREMDLTPQEASQVYGFELNSNPFNLPTDDLKDYYIIDNKPIHKDTPNIAQLIAESASVGTIQMMTLAEVKDTFGYVVGVDPYRQEANSPTDLEQAQASIEAWDAVANGPAPDLSILEEEDKPDSSNDTVDPIDLW